MLQHIPSFLPRSPLLCAVFCLSLNTALPASETSVRSASSFLSGDAWNSSIRQHESLASGLSVDPLRTLSCPVQPSPVLSLRLLHCRSILLCAILFLQLCLLHSCTQFCTSFLASLFALLTCCLQFYLQLSTSAVDIFCGQTLWTAVCPVQFGPVHFSPVVSTSLLQPHPCNLVLCAEVSFRVVVRHSYNSSSFAVDEAFLQSLFHLSIVLFQSFHGFMDMITLPYVSAVEVLL